MTADEKGEITITFDADTLDRIRTAAAISGQPVEDFVMDAALDRAVKILLTDKVAFLSVEAYHTVCQTLLRQSAISVGH